MLTFIKPKVDILANNKIVYHKDRVYYPGPAEFTELNKNKDVMEKCNPFVIDQKISGYNEPDNAGVTKLLMFRNGGAGDMIAISAMCLYFDQYIQNFYTHEKYRDVFDWFERKPNKVLDARGVIFNTLSPTDLMKMKNTRRVVFEGKIEEGNRINWMDAFYLQNNCQSVPVEFKRPRLVKNRVGNHRQILGDNSILLCPKSTAQMRTTNIMELVNPLLEIGTNGTMYVHFDNLQSNEEFEYCVANNINIIKANTLGEYLADCYDASMVISVDSAPVHFREGVEKPCIGLYNAFYADSRCGYYNFVKTYNIKSTCQYQPCFTHEKYYGHVCHKAKTGDKVAPCLTQVGNKFLKEDLIRIYKENGL